MKILLVHNSADLYGASRSLLRLAAALPRRGFAPCLLLSAEGPLASLARARGLPVKIQSSLKIISRNNFHFLGMIRFFAGLPAAVRETARWIRQENFALVHTNLGTVVSSAWSARLAGIPHIWHIRDWFQEFGILWRPYARYILAFSERVVCVSRPIAAQFPPNPKVSVLHNGLDLAEFPPVTQPESVAAKKKFGFGPQEQVVGTVGRIKFVRKGQEYLLRAAHLLAQQRVPLRILLVGGAAPGSEDHIPRMKALARELGLEKTVVFAGELSDPRPAYAAMDIFVLPSAQPEPFGGVVLEAMALGRPVIATAIGGSPEQVVPDKTGFLIPPADTHALAEKLRTLLTDPALRDRMGQAGRERVAKDLSLDRTVEGITAIYRQVLKKKS
jgi:glycosyltransferase involved in cell wall biosynthesis